MVKCLIPSVFLAKQVLNVLRILNMVTDGNAGDYATWTYGGAIPLKMVVFAPSSLNGYTQFGPAGGTANNSGPGNLKVNVAWGITTGLTCTVDRSGL